MTDTIETTLRALASELNRGMRMGPADAPYLTRAANEIEDLRTQLQGTCGELENALSRERTLLKEQTDCRIGADNLEAEIERLRVELVSKTDELERQYRWHRLVTEAFAAERDATIRELRKVQEERDDD